MAPPPGRSARTAVHSFSVLKLAIQLACLTPYGWFRDDLYYVASSDHLACCYVDHPPFSVALLAVWRRLLGETLGALRLGPAVAGTAVVALTGALVLELGGGALAVALACGAVIAAPASLLLDHLWPMNAFDHVFWIAAAILTVRATR